MTPDEKAQLIIDSYTNYVDSFDAINKNIYEQLLKQLYQLDIKDGKFVDGESSATVVTQLKKELKKILLTGSGYNTSLNILVRNIGEIETANVDLQESINKIDVSKKLITPTKEFYINDTVNRLTGAGVDENFTTPISQALMRNIILGSSVSATADYLKSYVVGDGEQQTKLQRYAGQIAVDAIRGYDGQVNQIIINEYGLDAINYVGALVRDSRGQCVRWVGMRVIKIEDLQDEIDLAYSNEGKTIEGHKWSGMIPGTTPQNFAINCGGYRCEHTAVPVYSKYFKK